jgi:hypothetical protein
MANDPEEQKNFAPIFGFKTWYDNPVDEAGQHICGGPEDSRAVNSLIQETASRIDEDYYEKFLEVFANHGLADEVEGKGPVPYAAWAGVLRAVADLSGSRVILQSHVLEPDADDPDTFHVVGFRDVVIADSTDLAKDEPV